MKKTPTRAKKVKRSRKGKEPQWRPMHLSAEAVERLEKLQKPFPKVESIPRELLGRFPSLFGEPIDILAARLSKQSLEGAEAEGARIKAMFETMHGLDSLYSIRKTDTVTVNLPDDGTNMGVLRASRDPAFHSGIKAGNLPILAAPSDAGKSALYSTPRVCGAPVIELTLEQARLYVESLRDPVGREDVLAFIEANQPSILRVLQEKSLPDFQSMSAHFPPNSREAQLKVAESIMEARQREILEDMQDVPAHNATPTPTISLLDYDEDIPFCEDALAEYHARKARAKASLKRVTRQMDRNEYYVRYGVDMPDTMHFCGPDVTPVECPVCRAYQFTKDSMALRYVDLRTHPSSNLRRTWDMLHGELECRSCHHRFSYRLRTHNVVEVDKAILNQKTFRDTE